MAAIVAASIGACGAPAVVWGALHPNPSPRPQVSAARTGGEDESAARTEAASLLRQFSLPAGATESVAEPAGDGGFLAGPGSTSATPNFVDDHEWWIVPGPAREVLRWVTAHHPAGVRGSAGGYLSTSGVIDVEYGQLLWPPIPGVLSTRALMFGVVQLPDGSTALRADAQVVWVTPRPPSETIPPGARLLRISLISELKGDRLRQRPIVVTSAKKIRETVALLNALPAAQPGTWNCPADFGVRVEFGLYAKRGARPLAVAEADPWGCGFVRLSIKGVAEPALAGGSSLVQRVQEVLGIRLTLRPS